MIRSRTAELAIVMLLSGLGVSDAQTTQSFGGRLYRSVSDGGAQRLLTNSDRNKVPVSLRVRYDHFVRCRASFRSGLPPPKTFFGKAASTHQRALERALACLFEGPDVAAAATEYAGNARILYEWEGLSSSPIEEADYAEAYIAEHPRSRFVPYLYLFAVERWRYAFEFFVGERDAEGIAQSSAQYRELIARAREADPFIRLVADDLDEQPYLTTDVGKHPRDP